MQKKKKDSSEIAVLFLKFYPDKIGSIYNL